MEHKNPRPNIVLALRLVMFAVRARAGILVRWINQPLVEAAAKSIAPSAASRVANEQPSRLDSFVASLRDVRRRI